IGTSTFGAWQIVESLWASKELGLNRFVSEQPPYNLLDRRIERELIPMCRTYGIAIIPWSPLAGGLLTGKYRAGADRPADSRYSEPGKAPMNRDHPGAFDRIESVLEIAVVIGLRPSVFSLAWVMSREGITSPIIGPRTMEQLKDNLEALEVEWKDEWTTKVDEAIPPGTHVSDYYKADFGPNARWM
ncbi:MAG: aldo/keto reductase, partial [Chthonomonadales bacterium]